MPQDNKHTPGDEKKERAKWLLKLFARNQVNMTKAANTRRGVSKKLIKEERNLTEYLLIAMGVTLTDQETNDLIKEFS